MNSDDYTEHTSFVANESIYTPYDMLMNVQFTICIIMLTGQGHCRM